MKCICRYTVPVGEWMESDGELKYVGESKGKQHWVKSGFTQGAPWSPLLSAIPLNWSYPVKEGMDLVMYADDEIVFMDDESKTPQMDNWIIGTTLARNKNCGWAGRYFKFLGIVYDRIEQTLSGGGLEVSWYAKEEEILKVLKYSEYENKYVNAKEVIRIEEYGEETEFDGHILKVGKNRYGWIVKDEVYHEQNV